jgi:hypothetical protein
VKVDVDWVSADRRGTVTLDDGGRPFRTMGVDGIPSSCGTQQSVVTLDCR